MPKFSINSEKELLSCNGSLVKLFNEVIKTYDCTVLEGFRSDADQDKAFKEGKSKSKPGQSKHNIQPSMAADVAPYPINWEDKKRFYHFAGFVQGVAKQMDINIRWGGDWDRDNDLGDQAFNDLVHFELI